MVSSNRRNGKYENRNWLLIRLDIPNCKTVKLSDSLKYVNKEHSSISSSNNQNELIIWIDVHSSLSSTIDYCRYSIDFSLCEYLSSMDLYSTELNIPDSTCIGSETFTFCFTGLMSLEEIEIGNENFALSNKFIVNRLNKLKKLKIGKNSFTNHKNSYGDIKSRSFLILNCEKLKSIEIGQYSFSDYAGEFELKNLPSLKSIEIGELSKSSLCFYVASFRIQGMGDFIIFTLDLPSLKTIQLGYDVFAMSMTTVIHSICEHMLSLKISPN